MFSVGCQPVEMFGAVVNRVKSPKKVDTVLKSVSPIDKEVAEYYHLESLKPPGLTGYGFPELGWDQVVEPEAVVGEKPQNKPAPKKILAEEKTEICPPIRSKEALFWLGWEGEFQRSKEKKEKPKAGR